MARRPPAETFRSRGTHWAGVDVLRFNELNYAGPRSVPGVRLCLAQNLVFPPDGASGFAGSC